MQRPSLAALDGMVVLGNTLPRWALAAAVAVGALFLLVLLRRFFRQRYERMAATAEVEFLETAFRVAQRTTVLFLLTVSLAAGLSTLSLTDRQLAVVTTVAILAFCWQAGLWMTTALTAWLERRRLQVVPGHPGAGSSLDIIGFIGRAVIWVIVLLLTLDNAGVNITTLVAGLGIGGVAVALAVQTTLGDLLASLSIAFDKPFVIGDFLIVGDFMGSVEAIGIKSTRLRSLTGEQLILSNADLLASRIRNYQSLRERRVVFTVPVSPDTSRDQIRKLVAKIRSFIEKHKDLRFDRCHFAKIGTSSLDLEAVYYVLGADFNKHMDLQQAINLDILEALESEAIEVAYPRQKVLVASGRNAGNDLLNG